MDPIPTPHDRFFRESFGRQEIAQDFLMHQLPQELLVEIDLETLAIGKDSYVFKDLSAHYSDLVYTVGYRGGELKVYLLFEHKSQPEPWPALQLLRYVAAGGEQHRKQYPQTQRLPPVFPLVLYHGQAQWRMPASFHELVDPLSPELEPYVPQFCYALHDISVRTDVQIRGEVLTRLAQLAMRHIYSTEPLERLQELLVLIGEVLESILRYDTRHTRVFGRNAHLSHPIAALRLLAIKLAITRCRALLSGTKDAPRFPENSCVTGTCSGNAAVGRGGGADLVGDHAGRRSDHADVYREVYRPGRHQRGARRGKR